MPHCWRRALLFSFHVQRQFAESLRSCVAALDTDGWPTRVFDQSGIERIHLEEERMPDESTTRAQIVTDAGAD